MPTTASTGWGVTVSATRSSTPGARSKTRAPRRRASSTTADTSGCEPARSSTNTASTGAPASSALREQLDPFDDEGPFRAAHTAPRQQPPQALDPLVPEGERSGQERSPASAATGVGAPSAKADVATATRREKASGSVTARSASTLRSTSTSAWRSPAMSRL